MLTRNIHLISEEIELHREHFEFEKLASERLMVKPRFSIVTYPEELLERRVETIGSKMRDAEKAEYGRILRQRREYVEAEVTADRMRMVDIYHFQEIRTYAQTGKGLLEGKPVEASLRAKHFDNILKLLKCPGYELLLTPQPIGFDFLITSDTKREKGTDPEDAEFVEGALMLVSTEIRASGMNRSVVITIPSVVQRFREIFYSMRAEALSSAVRASPQVTSNIESGSLKSSLKKALLKQLRHDYPFPGEKEWLCSAKQITKELVRTWLQLWANHLRKAQPDSVEVSLPPELEVIDRQLAEVSRPAPTPEGTPRSQNSENRCPYGRTDHELCAQQQNKKCRAVVSFDVPDNAAKPTAKTVESLEQALCNTLQDIGFEPLTARKQRKKNWSKVCRAIGECDLLVADMSFWGDGEPPPKNVASPRVALELGMAIGKRKHVLLTFREHRPGPARFHGLLSNLSGSNAIPIRRGIADAYSLEFLAAVRRHIEAVLPEILELKPVVEDDIQMQDELQRIDSLKLERCLVRNRFTAPTYTNPICEKRAAHYFKFRQCRPGADYERELEKRCKDFESLLRSRSCIDIYSMKETFAYPPGKGRTADSFLKSSRWLREAHVRHLLRMLVKRGNRYDVLLTDERLGLDYVLIGPVLVLTSSDFTGRTRGFITTDSTVVQNFKTQFTELKNRTLRALEYEFEKLNEELRRAGTIRSPRLRKALANFKEKWQTPQCPAKARIKAGVRLYLELSLWHGKETATQTPEQWEADWLASWAETDQRIDTVSKLLRRRRAVR